MLAYNALPEQTEGTEGKNESSSLFFVYIHSVGSNPDSLPVIEYKKKKEPHSSFFYPIIYYMKNYLILFRKVHATLAHILGCGYGNASTAILADSAIEMINNALVLHHAWFVGILRIKLLRWLDQWFTLPICPMHKVI